MVGLETEFDVSFYRVESAILQLVGAQLIEQSDASAFLVLVDQQSASLLRNLIERQLELRTAIAAQTVEHVAREALRMDAHQRRPQLRGKVSQLQNHGLFNSGWPYSLETEYAEMAKSAGEIGFRNLSYRKGLINQSELPL